MQKEVLLKEIKPHPNLKKFTERFAEQKKILHDPGIFTPEAALLINKLLPMTVVRKGKNYLYISGHITYCLIAQMFDPRAKINVEVIKRANVKELNQYICSDLLLLPILAGLAKPEIGERYDMLKKNSDCDLRDLFTVHNQKDLCRALNCSRNTLFKSIIQEGSND